MVIKISFKWKDENGLHRSYIKRKIAYTENYDEIKDIAIGLAEGFIPENGTVVGEPSVVRCG